MSSIYGVEVLKTHKHDIDRIEKKMQKIITDMAETATDIGTGLTLLRTLLDYLEDTKFLCRGVQRVNDSEFIIFEDSDVGVDWKVQYLILKIHEFIALIGSPRNCFPHGGISLQVLATVIRLPIICVLLPEAYIKTITNEDGSTTQIMNVKDGDEIVIDFSKGVSVYNPYDLQLLHAHDTSEYFFNPLEHAQMQDYAIIINCLGNHFNGLRLVDQADSIYKILCNNGEDPCLQLIRDAEETQATDSNVYISDWIHKTVLLLENQSDVVDAKSLMISVNNMPPAIKVIIEKKEEYMYLKQAIADNEKNKPKVVDLLRRLEQGIILSNTKFIKNSGTTAEFVHGVQSWILGKKNLESCLESLRKDSTKQILLDNDVNTCIAKVEFIIKTVDHGCFIVSGIKLRLSKMKKEVWLPADLARSNEHIISLDEGETLLNTIDKAKSNYGALQSRFGDIFLGNHSIALLLAIEKSLFIWKTDAVQWTNYHNQQLSEISQQKLEEFEVEKSLSFNIACAISMPTQFILREKLLLIDRIKSELVVLFAAPVPNITTTMLSQCCDGHFADLTLHMIMKFTQLKIQADDILVSFQEQEIIDWILAVSEWYENVKPWNLVLLSVNSIYPRSTRLNSRIVIEELHIRGVSLLRDHSVFRRTYLQIVGVLIGSGDSYYGHPFFDTCLSILDNTRSYLDRGNNASIDLSQNEGPLVYDTEEDVPDNDQYFSQIEVQDTYMNDDDYDLTLEDDDHIFESKLMYIGCDHGLGNACLNLDGRQKVSEDGCSDKKRMYPTSDCEHSGSTNAENSFLSRQVNAPNKLQRLVCDMNSSNTTYSNDGSGVVQSQEQQYRKPNSEEESVQICVGYAEFFLEVGDYLQHLHPTKGLTMVSRIAELTKSLFGNLIIRCENGLLLEDDFYVGKLIRQFASDNKWDCSTSEAMKVYFFNAFCLNEVCTICILL